MIKTVRSKGYNYNFDYKTGLFVRWGKTQQDDPLYSPFGPEIADIEISTVCNGLGKPCSHCYKSNTGCGENMSFDTFKKLFHKLPKNLTQIAFGIGDIDANPDLFKIFEYCRTNEYNSVVPNVTINGYKLTDSIAQKLAKYCGAVAVSRYNPKDCCYDAVKKLTDLGMTQVNIHMLVSEETYENCLEVLKDTKSDPRLEKLNAVVFLTLKPKGKRNHYRSVTDLEKYKNLINMAFKNKVRIGFDSCFAPLFLEVVKNYPNYKSLEILAEPCESMLFSIYINTEGKTSPCSFTEGEVGYEGLDVVGCKDFKTDIWNHPTTKAFREKLLNNKCGSCRGCPAFDIYKALNR